MPWNPVTGVFERHNPDYSGPTVWDQDRQGGVKIIATRHDYHDQDMADGITQSLNVNGYNMMLGSLNLNDNRIINAANATDLDDVPRYGQIAGDMTFDDGTRVLELLDRDGNPIDSVVIPSGSGGGGTGSVTAINIGEGLTGAQNPIETEGDIKLATIGAQQTFSGGIGGITIDKHGRVTQVTQNAFKNPNLGNTPDSDSVVITVNGGTPTDILGAVADSRAGVMTALQAKQLQDLVNAGTGGGMIPPIELKGVDETPKPEYMRHLDSVLELAVSAADDGDWKTVRSETGSGIIEFLGFSLRSPLSAGRTLAFRLLIDGIAVYTGIQNFVSTDAVHDGFAIIGGVSNYDPTGPSSDPAPMTQPVKYNTSFEVQARDNVTGVAEQGYVYIKYQIQS